MPARKPRKAQSPKTTSTAPASIDRQSGDVVLEYREGKAPGSGIPARDLTATDLARILYVRKFAATPAELGQRRARPKPATPAEMAKLADQLVATGNFRHAKAGTKPADAVTAETPPATSPEPVPPADADAADAGDEQPDQPAEGE